jgi:hypothetical protein
MYAALSKLIFQRFTTMIHYNYQINLHHTKKNVQLSGYYYNYLNCTAMLTAKIINPSQQKSQHNLRYAVELVGIYLHLYVHLYHENGQTNLHQTSNASSLGRGRDRGKSKLRKSVPSSNPGENGPCSSETKHDRSTTP